MRAVHSTIFPLGLKRKTKTANWSRILQIMSGNTAIVVLGFTIAMTVGQTDKIFLTENMVKAFGMTASLLILHTILASLRFTSLSTEQDNNDFEMDPEDATEETPPLNSQRQTKCIPTKILVLLTFSILLILALPYPLLLFVFNSCSTLHSSQITNITCTSATPTVGSRCSVSCSPLYWSSSYPQSVCTWRGVWSVELGCRRQAAAVIQLLPEKEDEGHNLRSVVEGYPTTY